MADNQITPFQLTDQFTMDNFNQRINETNTALQKKAESDSVYAKTETDALLANKAPSGFGLGEEIGKDVPDQSTMDITFANGWYKCAFAVTPFNTGGTLFVIGRGRSNYVVQQYYPSGQALKLTYGMRSYNGTSWSDWEWVNPPMQLGVEYRTTERYRGKPVYQKLIDFGALPNNTQKSVSIFASGETNTMECGIDVKLISHANQAYKTTNTLVLQVLQTGGVTVKTNYNDSATSVYALCYYTKTTD